VPQGGGGRMMSRQAFLGGHQSCIVWAAELQLEFVSCLNQAHGDSSNSACGVKAPFCAAAPPSTYPCIPVSALCVCGVSVEVGALCCCYLCLCLCLCVCLCVSVGRKDSQ